MSLITIIRPPIVVPKWAHTTIVCPPVGMAYLASSLRAAKHPVKLIDSVGEAVFSVREVDTHRSLMATGLTPEQVLDRIDPKTTLFGFSCMFSNEWPIAYHLIEEVRRAFPGRPIVVGGEHINSVPEFTLAHYPAVDICALGEGEETIVEIMNRHSRGESLQGIPGIAFRENGLYKENPGRARINSVDDIPLPAWDLIPMHNYLDNSLGYGVNRGRSMPLMATRGCPYQCTFCSSPTMWTTKWIARDVDKVLNEIQGYIDGYRATNIDFYDLTAVIKKDWIVKFCQTIVERKMNFTWQLPSGTRSEAIDGEVTHWMSRSGCKNITYAPESGSPAVLKRIKKKVLIPRMKESMRNALKNGMVIKTNIIMGFPDETHFEIWQTILFMAHLAIMGVEDAVPANFSPYPGSELFESLRAEGKIPQLDDEYFWNLSVQTSFFRAVSVSKYVSSRALSFYLVFSLALFYALSFLFHPWRFFKMFFINPFKNIQESRFEKGYQGVFRRFFPKKEALSSGSRS